MNAIIKARNGERLNAIISIERTGVVSAEARTLIETVKRNESVIAVGFSNEDLKYYQGYYQTNKLPKAEQALAYVKGLWQDANYELARLTLPGFKMNPHIERVKSERNRLFADVQSITTRITRVKTVINTMADELLRRKREWLKFIPKPAPVVKTPAPVAAKPAMPPAPVKAKAKKSSMKANPPKYKPELSVMGGFAGLKEALQQKSSLLS